ncbi:MAG: hypothetical protein H7X77_00075 [Anaerolineae bacterium]|nr:hypothetical protein [Anaerolineae bacterium]
MKKLLFILAMLLNVLSVHAVFAVTQPVDDRGITNDPSLNENANACYDDGTLELVCGTTDVDGDGVVSEADITWMWTAGWYLIRYEYGLITPADFPDAYRGIIGNQGGECSLKVNADVQAYLGLSSPIVNVPLDVINGLVDPDASTGATPYGFDWLDDQASGGESYSLVLYGPGSAVVIWDYWFNWNTDTVYLKWIDYYLVDHQCPTPTPYFLL